MSNISLYLLSILILTSLCHGFSSAPVTCSMSSSKKGKVLVLGGSGFLGQTVCRKATLEGYQVVSLSRRGMPSRSTGIDESVTTQQVLNSVDYRLGDARSKGTVEAILEEGGFVGVIHCIGLLFDNVSGFGDFNRFVSGSGSVPEKGSSYDDITRKTAFNAIDATESFAKKSKNTKLPFLFTSAAEAGWPEVPGGSFVENNVVPGFLRRYLVAKRAVESKLSSSSSLRPIIFRPSLIYSLDRVASLPSVGAFFVGNRIGLPFVDRPVTVQSLGAAMVRAIGDDSVSGIQRFSQIDKLSR